MQNCVIHFECVKRCNLQNKQFSTLAISLFWCKTLQMDFNEYFNKAANVLAAGLSNGSRPVTGGSPLLTNLTNPMLPQANETEN